MSIEFHKNYEKLILDNGTEVTHYGAFKLPNVPLSSAIENVPEFKLEAKRILSGLDSDCQKLGFCIQAFCTGQWNFVILRDLWRDKEIEGRERDLVPRFIFCNGFIPTSYYSEVNKLTEYTYAVIPEYHIPTVSYESSKEVTEDNFVSKFVFWNFRYRNQFRKEYESASEECDDTLVELFSEDAVLDIKVDYSLHRCLSGSYRFNKGANFPFIEKLCTLVNKEFKENLASPLHLFGSTFENDILREEVKSIFGDVPYEDGINRKYVNIGNCELLSDADTCYYLYPYCLQNNYSTVYTDKFLGITAEEYMLCRGYNVLSGLSSAVMVARQFLTDINSKGRTKQQDMLTHTKQFSFNNFRFKEPASFSYRTFDIPEPKKRLVSLAADNEKQLLLNTLKIYADVSLYYKTSPMLHLPILRFYYIFETKAANLKLLAKVLILDNLVDNYLSWDLIVIDRLSKSFLKLYNKLIAGSRLLFGMSNDYSMTIIVFLCQRLIFKLANDTNLLSIDYSKSKFVLKLPNAETLVKYENAIENELKSLQGNDLYSKLRIASMTNSLDIYISYYYDKLVKEVDRKSVV